MHFDMWLTFCCPVVHTNSCKQPQVCETHRCMNEEHVRTQVYGFTMTLDWGHVILCVELWDTRLQSKAAFSQLRTSVHHKSVMNVQCHGSLQHVTQSHTYLKPTLGSSQTLNVSELPLMKVRYSALPTKAAWQSSRNRPSYWSIPHVRYQGTLCERTVSETTFSWSQGTLASKIDILFKNKQALVCVHLQLWAHKCRKEPSWYLRCCQPYIQSYLFLLHFKTRVRHPRWQSIHSLAQYVFCLWGLINFIGLFMIRVYT